MLVLPTALGVVAVGAAIHLVLWSRGSFARLGARLGAVRRFTLDRGRLQIFAFAAAISCIRGPDGVPREQRGDRHGSGIAQPPIRPHRRARGARARGREGARAREATATGELVRRAAEAARWFDIKEHWIALGISRCSRCPRCSSYPGSGIRGPHASSCRWCSVFPWSLPAPCVASALMGILTASWRAM
jgi:hypothetical protein